jgi:hypothetical protein
LLLGDADVIRVAVRDDDRRQVGGRAPEETQPRLELRPVVGKAGVDDDHPVVVVEEEPVAEIGSETHDAVGGERRFHDPPQHRRGAYEMRAGRAAAHRPTLKE